ncbi:sulfurtransferase TusA family protein [Thalassotalea aquiviva]|uniref:sulfurtransferase TusA family protein n=1 Tax=Thalassotalea aquiviva TaxID=3242415 RepID=UPI003529E3A2
MIALSEIEYNAEGERCPLPLVKTKLLLKQLGAGQRLKLILTDPGSIADIPKWLTSQGIEFSQNHQQDVVEIIINKEKFIQ